MKNKTKILIIVYIILFLYLLCFYHFLYINALRSRFTYGYLGCQSNMIKLGKMLEQYAIEHESRYPQKDSKDFQSIVNSIPLCPAFKAKKWMEKIPLTKNPYYLGYEVDSIGYRFTICCKGGNHEIPGNAIMGDYPRYNDIFGLENNSEQSMENKLPPLYTAVYENSPARVKELLAGKPDLSKEVDTLGRTPLHTAAAFGYVDIAEMLIAHGVDINPRDEWGWTPLKWAKSRNRSEMVKLLKTHGATE